MISHHEHKRLLEKIKKLLALSKSPNENEALLAASKAREMLSKYNLSLEEMDVQDIREREYHTGTKNMPGWLIRLASSVSRGFSCDVYYKRGGNSAGCSICFVGTELDAEIAEYVFEYLKSTVERLTAAKMQNLEADDRSGCMDSGYRVRVKNSYRIGLVSALDEKIRGFSEMCKGTESRQKEKWGGIYGMVPVEKTALTRYMEGLGLKRASRGRTFVVPDGYRDGLRDGEEINIKKGIRARSSSLLKLQ